MEAEEFLLLPLSVKGTKSEIRGKSSKKMAAKQMEEIQRKLAMLNYPRANAPAQSLLFAGMERYALLEWLFFKSVSLFLSCTYKKF